jgi:hypothetical protein
MRDLLTDWAHQSFTERQRETQEAAFFFYLSTPVEEGGSAFAVPARGEHRR